MPEHQQTQQSTELKTTSQKQTTSTKQIPASNPMVIIQRARINPKSLTQADVMQLQRTIGNRAVSVLFSEIGLIPSTAKQASPIQRQEIPEEENSYLSCMQKQEISEEKELLQGKIIGTIQRQEIPEEEEEPLQGKMTKTIQIQENPEEEEPLQTKKENNTGMPDNLKAGVENLSGIDMSDVRVHYSSDKPAEVGALAYTQGTDIHVAPRQEKHLPHEAWHVVQQAQGRVRPTMQLKGLVINSDDGLELEAEEMGERVVQIQIEPASTQRSEERGELGGPVIQRVSTCILSGTERFNFLDSVKSGATDSVKGYKPSSTVVQQLRDKVEFIRSTPSQKLQLKPSNIHSTPVSQLLKDEYQFTENESIEDLTNQYRGVYRFKFSDESVVVKDEVSPEEIGLNNFGRQAGLNAPIMRRLTQKEKANLTNIPKIRIRSDNGVVMEYVEGEKLQGLRIDNDGDDLTRKMPNIFNPQLLRQIGKSYGFQLLTGSADRWPMPVNVGPQTLSEGNSGNMLVDTGTHSLKDIDFTPGNRPDYYSGYAEELRNSFLSMLRNANGGDLVQSVVNMIAKEYNANYTIPDEGRGYIVEGIQEVMNYARTLDISNADFGELPSTYKERIQHVREVYEQVRGQVLNQVQTEKAQVQTETRVQTETQAHSHGCKCFITTACTRAMGLDDQCLQLRVLRAFRDIYIYSIPGGEEMINYYYLNSPEIVEVLDHLPDSDSEYSHLFQVINACVEYIFSEKYEEAILTYIQMVISLINKYLPMKRIPKQFIHIMNG